MIDQLHSQILSGVLMLLLSCCLLDCANIVAPTGGPKDTEPPRLDSLRSTPNFQTRFEKQDILLTFDEWVQLKDVFKQVVVTPPLSTRPEVNLKKKTVIFEFPPGEELRPDATYIINFGKAVVDLTEGNVAPDLRFVFSTGDYIDSLEVMGSIVDAVSGQPVKDVLLMLYDNLDDSVVYKEKPFYFSRSDDKGQLRISNIRSDTFKVVALEDANLNYLFDPAGERIGFIDTVLILTDSILPRFEMQIFANQQPLRIADKNLKTYGQASLIFNQAPSESLEIDYQDIGQRTYVEYFPDSVKFWYDMDSVRGWELYVRQDSVLNDTLKIRPLDRGRFRKGRTLQLEQDKKAPSPLPLDLKKALLLTFQHPLQKYDSLKIDIFRQRDSSQVEVEASIRIDSLQKRQLVIEHDWQADTLYQVRLLPDALTDWFGLTNQDTLLLEYKCRKPEDYGSITLVLNDMDTTMAYLLEFRSKDGQLIATENVQGDALFQKVYPDLYKGNYSIHLVEDRNANGRWDTGSYEEKLQPERQADKDLKELPGNWEVNSEISVRQLLNEKPKPPASNKQKKPGS